MVPFMGYCGNTL